MTGSTALPLFDLLRLTFTGQGATAPARLKEFAQRLVDSLLDEYGYLNELDAQATPDAAQAFDPQSAVLFRSVYEQWAASAEALLSRIERLPEQARNVQRVNELGDAVGRTRAMLNVTLEDIERGQDQMARGELKSIEEVRRELGLGSHA